METWQRGECEKTKPVLIPITIVALAKFDPICLHVQHTHIHARSVPSEAPLWQHIWHRAYLSTESLGPARTHPTP